MNIRREVVVLRRIDYNVQGSARGFLVKFENGSERDDAHKIVKDKRLVPSQR